MRSDIAPGGIFPDYELPDHENLPRTLSEIQGDDPLILTLARGHYCPKEHQQHLELAANYPKIAVAYTKIATISTDTHHSSQEFRASVGAQWPFLSDPERIVQKNLDIQEYTDPEQLREAWDAGDYSRFHGWDRRSPQSLPSSYNS
jgi:peroxiredoxin